MAHDDSLWYYSFEHVTYQQHSSVEARRLLGIGAKPGFFKSTRRERTVMLGLLRRQSDFARMHITKTSPEWLMRPLKLCMSTGGN